MGKSWSINLQIKIRIRQLTYLSKRGVTMPPSHTHTHKFRDVRLIQTTMTECCGLDSANSDDSRNERCQPPSRWWWWWWVAAEWRPPPPSTVQTDLKACFALTILALWCVSLWKGQFYVSRNFRITLTTLHLKMLVCLNRNFIFHI